MAIPQAHGDLIQGRVTVERLDTGQLLSELCDLLLPPAKRIREDSWNVYMNCCMLMHTLHAAAWVAVRRQRRFARAKASSPRVLRLMWSVGCAAYSRIHGGRPSWSVCGLQTRVPGSLPG